MKISEASDARDTLVQARVVFHRARAERIHAQINRIIPRRDAREVAHDINLADFGQTFEIIVTTKRGRDDFIKRRFVNVEWRQTITLSSGLRTLEDQGFILCDMWGSFCDFG